MYTVVILYVFVLLKYCVLFTLNIIKNKISVKITQIYLCFYIKKGKFIATKLTFSTGISEVTEVIYNYSKTVFYNL